MGGLHDVAVGRNIKDTYWDDKPKKRPFKALSKSSRQKMTKQQKDEYLAREEAKGSGVVRSPLTSRYS